MYSNFHTHTNYCDGHDSVRDLVRTALSLNIVQIGISSHAPLPVPAGWSLSNKEELEHYLNDILNNISVYGDQIDILKALEVDYIPEMSIPFSMIKNTWDLDYIIGAIHLVKVPDSDEVWFIDGNPHYFEEGISKYFGGDGRKACLVYFQQLKSMILSQDFDILAHFDKIKLNNAGRFFSEDEDWYIRETNEILDLLKHRNIIMEINTRGFYQNKRTDFYPSDAIIKKAAQMGVPMIVNSDAHKCDELCSGFTQAHALLKEYGVNHTYEFRNEKWIEKQITV